jgi:2-polyprenyl-3-methyl-5-hydroxy-6-metoxy-1,4-benzoquinol methylase
VDLGITPLANTFVRPENLCKPETFYPLHAYVCGNCFLVQVQEFQTPQDIFSDYAYFSSFSDTWLRHAQAYTKEMIKRFGLGAKSHVVEIASNDGYLLQFFKAEQISVLGIEPAKNVAEAAEKRGIPTMVQFFGEESGRQLAVQGHQADLLVANNVLAHVPELNDFVRGLKTILKPTGVATLEFPHLLKMIECRQFDTIYHEHFSYFSFHTVEQIFSSSGLRIFDVDELSTHGGSLRIYACRSENATYQVSENCLKLRQTEHDRGLDKLETYYGFDEAVRKTKRAFLQFVLDVKKQEKSIAAYGAPAKGNTLLVYCGIRPDFIDFTVDRSPHKQGLFLPGTRIPIKHPDELKKLKPDYVVILPWNLTHEIIEQHGYIREWGGKFVVPVPTVKVYE